MNIKAVLKNVKKHGIAGTLKIKRERVAAQRLAAALDVSLRQLESAETENDFKKILDGIFARIDVAKGEAYASGVSKLYEFIYAKRPYGTPGKEGLYPLYMELAQDLENRARGVKKLYKYITKGAKAHYIKELIPAAYEEEAANPVEQKLIFMENGSCPSPTNAHIINVLSQDDKYNYAIHKTGLHRRAVSELEYYENAFEFAKDAATAKAVLISSANDVFSHLDLRPETKLIQMWHGVGMYKRVGWSTTGKSFGKSETARLEYDQYRNYSYVTIAGEAQAWTFEDAMHISQDSGVLVPVGISRTDVFYSESYIQNTYKKLYEKLPQIEGKKIILYAPTFRGNVGSGKAPDQLDINALGEALSDEYVLLIKHHGLAKDVPPIPEKWANTFAFDLGATKILSIDRLLCIADICITDYSSIGFEYAIMERPIIFFAYDLEDYLDERGMYYDYDEITPGPICKTNEEMVDYITHLDERFDKQAVLDFKQKYVGACDGHATERTIALIES